MRNKVDQAQWVKRHYQEVIGLRVKERVVLHKETRTGLTQIAVYPHDFLVRTGGITRPYEIYGTDVYVHVPRSLCVRARITVDRMTGEIKSKRKIK